jgi:hypothetical protein
MSRPPADQPERILASDATDFERRVLGTAMQRKPSPEASARMAKALGITAATMGTGAAVTTVATNAAAAKAGAVAGTTAASTWISIGVIGLVVAGAVIGARKTRHAHDPAVAPAQGAAPVVPVQPAAPVQPSAPAPTPSVALAPTPHARTAAAGDLRDEVGLVGAARDAVTGDAARRALEILRRYQDKYPNGAFRPESGAIKIEALMKLGREAEARALAERFVAEHRGSLLAHRVADIAGLTER